MIEIQQLIVRAQVNKDEFEDRNIVDTIKDIVEEYIMAHRVVKEVEKKEIIEECTRTILEEIEFRSRI
jgi:hypothetical protein